MFHDIQNQLMTKQAVAAAAVVSADVYDFVKASTGINQSVVCWLHYSYRLLLQQVAQLIHLK